MNNPWVEPSQVTWGQLYKLIKFRQALTGTLTWAVLYGYPQELNFSILMLVITYLYQRIGEETINLAIFSYVP